MSDVNQRAIFRYTSARNRLLASALVAGLALLATWKAEIDLRILLVYDLSIGTYLAMLFARMSHADGDETRDLAEKKETTNGLVLSLAAGISATSLGGVGLMLHRSQAWTPLMAGVHLGLSLIAVFASWTLLHAVFAIHYARLYYEPVGAEGDETYRKGLDFPEEGLVDFWDFMYFSYTIAVCYQTSDVTIRSRAMRRLTLAHALLSFLNVTVILGIVVEIVSTVVSARGATP